MDSNDATAVHGGDISASNDNEEQSGAEWGGTKPRRVDTDLSRYFLSVSGALESNFADGAEYDAEDLVAFMNNVVEEMKNHEGSLSSDKKCSVVVESILKLIHSQRHATSGSAGTTWRTFFASCKPTLVTCATAGTHRT